MTTTARPESFQIAGEQVAATLADARLALESYADGEADPKLLHKCAEYLHSARGALQLLEVYGASLLAEEMELACQFLEAGVKSGELTNAAIEALSRAMVQLPAYIERVMGGGRDIPLVLLPLLNDLRAARGNPLLSESTLLLLNLEPADKSKQAKLKLTPSGEDLGELVVQLRPQFQLGLLGWIKGSNSDQDLRRMAGVADRLEHAASAEELHQLWWVVGGVLEALISAGLKSNVALKRLLGQSDREIKRLQQVGEAAYANEPPVELVNNLLYYIARSTQGGERCAAIRDAFNISNVAPGDEQVEEVRESLSAPSAKLMKTVADAIREDLAKVKDVLDIYVRMGMKDISDLAAQVGLLGKIGDTLGVLGLGSLREIVRSRTQELEEIVKVQDRVEEARLVGLAAALLEVEGRLDTELLGLIRRPVEADDVAASADPDFKEVTAAVMRECIINLARIKEAITQILAQPADSVALDGIEKQLRGISAGLMMLGKSRAVDVFSRVGSAITKCVQSNVLATDPDSINRLADSIVSLEYYMETLQAGRKEPLYMLDNAERSLEVLDSATPFAWPEDDAKAGSHTRTLKIDTEELEQLPAMVAPAVPVETSIIELPVLQTGDAQPDPELLEIFIEEAQEEILAVKRHFSVWVENQVDDEALITVRRSFHTLKGSGRMVGAALIGEYSWHIESLLNRIISKTIEPGPSLVSFLQDAIGALPQLLEQLESGAEPSADVGALAAAAVAFSGGAIPPQYALPSRQDSVVIPAVTQPDAAKAEVSEEPEAESTEIDPVLLDILARETAGHLAAIREYLDECAIDTPPYAITEEMHRACHTLHGSMTMARVNQATVISGPLYQLVEHLYRSDIGMPAELHQLGTKSADAIEAINECLRDPDRVPPDTAELAASLKIAVEKLAVKQAIDGVQTEVLVESPSADIRVAGEVEPDVTATQVAPEFDAEIAAIFSEEAAEILEAADMAIASLASNRGSTAPLAELRRHLHTLKGGARMTGVTTMGDFSHELESLLMRIDQGGMGLDDSAYSLLQASVDELHRMREQVLSGVVSPPSADLMARLAGVVEATMMTPVLLVDDEPVADIAGSEAADTEEPTVPELPVIELSGPEVDDESSEELAEAADDRERIHPPAEEERPEKPLIPEPDRLGELARELTDGQPPEFTKPLPEDLAATLSVPLAPDTAPRKEMARVDSAMLEDLLNNAGEISIFHSRLNQQMSSIQFNLVELGQTVQRLQQQLRLLEGETEAQILFRHQSEAEGDEAFDPLELDRYSTIQQLSRGLAETASDVGSIKDLLQNLVSDTESILTQQTRTTSELQDNLMRTRMVPFDQHVPRLSRLVRQQALESSKNVELVVEGSDGELDRQVMEKMLPPLEHMLRNAVIHGIEDPDTRQQSGKPAVARIIIRFRREGAQVLIDIADDGAGLDLQAIRQKAVEQGAVQADQQMTDEELAQLILKSGLSTADKLTQSAGRGIGMDVVISEVAKLGGTLAIDSVSGKGCTFTVRLPYTLAITQAFIVKVGSEVFALPLPTVEGIVRLSRKEFDERLQQDEPAVDFGGRNYRLRHLGLYLGLGPATLPADEDQVALILVDAGESSAALIVDETADSREIVVKPIGPQLAAIRGIAGATILGDGRIVVILDPGSLVRSAVPGSVEVKPVVTVEEDLLSLALVVDDSITMRRVTQRLLERNKMRVITAKDGIEALEVLQDHMPEIVILDIEMPRMDGYEFANNVRNTPETADLPIIMVTSRTGEKHRARAIELGINDYLGKPYQEHELLDAIRNILGDFNVGDKAREHDTVS